MQNHYTYFWSGIAHRIFHSIWKVVLAWICPRNALVPGMILICLSNLCQARKGARSSCTFCSLNGLWEDLVPLGLLLMKIVCWWATLLNLAIPTLNALKAGKTCCQTFPQKCSQVLSFNSFLISQVLKCTFQSCSWDLHQLFQVSPCIRTEEGARAPARVLCWITSLHHNLWL